MSLNLKTFDNVFSSSSSIFHTENTNQDAMDKLMEENGAYKNRVNGTLFTAENLGMYMDENFLMNFSADNINKDIYLQSIVTNNKHGLIGSGIVDILKTIGWTEKGEQKANTVYTVDNDIIIPEQTQFKYLAKILEIITKDKATSDSRSISKSFNLISLLIAFTINLLF